jgi:hypothetical protein
VLLRVREGRKGFQCMGQGLVASVLCLGPGVSAAAAVGGGGGDSGRTLAIGGDSAKER